MMPNSSWVAKWNGLSGCVPGVYALHRLEDTFEYANDDYIDAPTGSRNKRNRDDAYSDQDYSDE